MGITNTSYLQVLYYMHMQVFYWLGIALYGMDDHKEAIVAFSQGLVTNPKEDAIC